MSSSHEPGQCVNVTQANGHICTGVIYTIDPVSEAYYIAIKGAKRRPAMVVIMKHAIKTVEVTGACGKVELDRIHGFYNSSTVHNPIKTDDKRLRSLEGWLKRHRVPFYTTAATTGQCEELVVMGCVTVAPPYTRLSCKSTNDVVLARISDLIGSMPPQEDEEEANVL